MTQQQALSPEELEATLAAIARIPDDIRDQAFAAAGVHPGMFKALEQALEHNDPMAAVRYMRAHGGTFERKPWEFLIEGLSSPQLRPVHEVLPDDQPAATREESPAAHVLRDEAIRDGAYVGDGTPEPIPDPLPTDSAPPPRPDWLPPPGPAQPPQYGLEAAPPPSLRPPVHTYEQALQRANDFLDTQHIARVQPRDTPPGQIPGPRGEPSTDEHGEFSGGPGMHRDRPVRR